MKQGSEGEAERSVKGKSGITDLREAAAVAVARCGVTARALGWSAVISGANLPA